MYDSPELHQTAVWGIFAFAVITVVMLVLVTAPYGRHVRAGWGPQIPSRLGWILMESPAVVLFFSIYMSGEHRASLVPMVLLSMWMLHYVHRTFVFPFRMRISGKSIPVLIAGIAIVFNSLNAYVNSRWISHFGEYPSDWLTDPRFVFGASLFMLGWIINIHADTVLINLRKPGETGYVIPRGGLYERITAPNYFGEILEWTGWAIATWSWAGLAFAVYAVANLGPRAFANHRWYHERFPDYPPERKALVPFLL